MIFTTAKFDTVCECSGRTIKKGEPIYLDGNKAYLPTSDTGKEEAKIKAEERREKLSRFRNTQFDT